jgi:HlyD family secretion protein
MKRNIVAVVLPAAVLLTACTPSHSHRVQGYVEGEFVYIASPQSGALTNLAVARGDAVRAGDLLFSLERSPEQDALAEAQRRVNEGRASLADARKGKRAPEIQSLAAQVAQARAALQFSATEVGRQEALSRVPGAGSQGDLDKARAAHEEDAARLEQLAADLETARLGARDDFVLAQEANVRALESAQVRAEWLLGQKSQRAPQAGLVFDTLYRQGEWVEAGRPVVELLPPQNIKVRAFVPEAIIGALHQGDKLTVTVTGLTNALAGRISFISPQAEYTPPVIYSDESRGKLVFMIEAVFDPQTAAQLHPGQPVDVQLPL